MRHPGKSFNQAFEHYLFKVANACIDSAKPATQADLIHLLTKANQAVDQTSLARRITSSGPAKWEQVLELRSVDEQWLLGVRQAQQDHQRKYIVRLEEGIQTTYQRLPLQDSVLSEPRRCRLVTYHERTLLVAQHQLVQVQQLIQAG